MKTLLKLTMFSISILAISQAQAVITSAAQCSAYSKQKGWPMAWENGECVNVGGLGPVVPANGWNGN